MGFFQEVMHEADASPPRMKMARRMFGVGRSGFLPDVFMRCMRRIGHLPTALGLQLPDHVILRALTNRRLGKPPYSFSE